MGSKLLPALRRFAFASSLAWIPLGLAGALLGLHLDVYALAAGGLALAGVGAVLWQNDQDPDHPASRG